MCLVTSRCHVGIFNFWGGRMVFRLFGDVGKSGRPSFQKNVPKVPNISHLVPKWVVTSLEQVVLLGAGRAVHLSVPFQYPCGPELEEAGTRSGLL